MRKLTQELRDAAERYMRDLAQQAPQRRTTPTPSCRSRTSKSMLDRMEDIARNGARQDAEAMLDRNAGHVREHAERARRPGRPGEREMRKQMSELGKLLRDQQALRDDTFRRDQREQLAPRRARGEPGRSAPSRRSTSASGRCATVSPRCSGG